MNKNVLISHFCIAILVFCLKSNPVNGQFSFDVEAGSVSTGYNDVRIPGNSGTFISFSEELSGKVSFYSRVRASYRFGARSEILALYAPLELTYKGTVDKDIVFQGESFASNSRLNATYMFNSYRATYRYYIISKPKIDFAAGLTLKIRHANISIEGELGQLASKPDLGVVPLINFWLHWQPTNRFGLLLDGDALAAPQGRAEDVLVAITYKATNNFSIKAGYRLLEGGADNASVYTFSMFHYLAFGAIIRLE
jgi:hypothetical protein